MEVVYLGECLGWTAEGGMAGRKAAAAVTDTTF